MDVKINAVKFDADKKLIEFVNKKLDKMAHFYEAITEAEVFLRLENTQDEANKVVEVKLLIPGDELFAKKQAKSFEEAMSEVEKTLSRALTKHKERNRG